MGKENDEEKAQSGFGLWGGDEKYVKLRLNNGYRRAAYNREKEKEKEKKKTETEELETYSILLNIK